MLLVDNVVLINGFDDPTVSRRMELMSDVNVITCLCGCCADMPSAVGDYVG